MKLHIHPVAVATALAALTTSASAQVYLDGFQNTAVGQATVSMGPTGQLLVDNLGSSGMDGVRMTIPCALGASIAVHADLGTSGTASFDAEAMRAGFPAPVHVGMDLFADGSGSAYFCRPEFSAVGDATYDLRVMYQGQIVLELEDQTGPTKMANNQGNPLPDKVYLLDSITDEDGFLQPVQLCFVEEGTVTPPGGGNAVQADFVEFISNPPQQEPGPITSFEALSLSIAGPPSFTVEAEEMRHYGLWMSGLDDAHLETTPTGKLKVSNLGSSGCDGVSIVDPDEDEDYDEMIGAVQELAASGENGGIVKLESEAGTGEIHSVSAEDLGGTWLFTPDFSQVGSQTYTLELFHSGQQVFSQGGMTGPGVSTAAWALFYKRTIEHPDGTVTTEWCIGGSTASAHTVSGGPTIVADMFTMRSQSLQSLPTPKCLNVRAGNLTGNELIVESVATGEPCVGTNYCVAAPNSVGSGAVMCASGSSSVAGNDLVLGCTGLPTNQFGIFYYGPNQIQAAFGDGFRCVGGSVLRLPILNSGPGGALSYALDNTAPPEPSGQIQAGSTWNFQCWYRDPGAGGAGFNLSDGTSIEFTP